VRVIYVPIERLEERYSAQWDDWFQAAFKREGIEFIKVGSSENKVITHGQFLDVIETNRYKAGQLKVVMDIIALDPMKPTTVFFMDLWFPGIQSLAYIREGMSAPLKIKGMLHAGTYDPHDFLTQKSMGVWGLPFEQSILNLADKIFIATEFHKALMEWSGLTPVNKDKFEIVPWPVEHEYLETIKEDIVLFPHRLAPEKQPEQFDLLKMMYSKKYSHFPRWFKTKDVAKTKAEYHWWLAKSKVAVSCALQETYGLAMIEAVNNGCFPVAPNRLSYPETLGGFTLYNNLDEAVELIHEGLTKPHTIKKVKTKDISWINRIL
jgi:hypothetical protein